MFVITELDDVFIHDNHVLVEKSMITNIIFSSMIMNVFFVSINEVKTTTAKIATTNFCFINYYNFYFIQILILYELVIICKRYITVETALSHKQYSWNHNAYRIKSKINK